MNAESKIYPICPNCKKEIKTLLSMDLPIPSSLRKYLGSDEPSKQESKSKAQLSSVPLLGCPHCKTVLVTIWQINTSHIGAINIAKD